MRYIELLSEQQLDEVRMSPKAFRKFLNSPEAEGMMAGFEAEMWFSNVLETGEEESEPDYDEDTTVDSIRHVLRFFDNSCGPSQLRRAEDRMREDYHEWADRMIRDKWDFDEEDHIEEFIISEGDYDKESSMVEYLMDELSINEGEAEEIVVFGKHASMSIKMRESDPTMWDAYLDSLEYARETLKNMVENVISSKGREYDRAFDHYIENEEYPDESEWFESESLTYMSEFGDRYHLEWPYYTNGFSGVDPGEYDYDVAHAIGERLKSDLGVKVQVYRSVRNGNEKENRPPDTWVIEPDGSLGDEREESDMPLEISSPPMSLKQCFEMMNKFYTWANQNNGYANYECSCHMGVSLPQPVGGKIDIIKLALFLGDKHVLEEFDRLSNTYAESAMDKIERKIYSTTQKNQEQIDNAIEHMKNGLVQLATSSIKLLPMFELGSSSEGYSNIRSGMGKYTSIHPHYDDPDKTYVEFRGAGGEDYFESPNDIQKLQNTLMRYSKAMAIASNPNAERNEYIKKLTKLLKPSIGNYDELRYFVQYATGEITIDQLKSNWATFLAKEKPEQQSLAQQIFAKQNQQPVSPSDSTQHNSAGDMGIYNANIGPITIRNATPYFRFNYNSVPHMGWNNVLTAWAARNRVSSIDYIIANVPPEIGQTVEISPNVRAQATTGQPQSAFTTPQQSTGQPTGWWKIVDANGNELHRFRGMGNYQSTANQMASQWARENGITDPIEVYPVST